MVENWPFSGDHRLDVPIFVKFDQAIDRRAMLGRIRVTANKQTVATKLLDDAEIAEAKDIEDFVARAKTDAQSDRWLAFRAAPMIARRLGKTGIHVVTRLMGLIIAAISIEMIASGLVKLFPGLLA